VTYYGPRPRHPGSEIRFFVNGQDQGVAFRDVYLGKYHPAFSSYYGGVMAVNFGATPFQYPPPEAYEAKPMAACFVPKPAPEVVPEAVVEGEVPSNEQQRVPQEEERVPTE
jgi:hypothetical protein